MRALSFHQPSNKAPELPLNEVDLGQNYKSSRDFFLDHWRVMATCPAEADRLVDTIYRLDWTR